MRVCVERTDKEPLNRDCSAGAAAAPPSAGRSLHSSVFPSYLHRTPIAPINRTCAAPLSARAARAARAAHAAHAPRAQATFAQNGLSQDCVHGSSRLRSCFLFCLPIAFGGLKGFLSMMAEPEVVTWDKCVRCPCRALPRAT